MYVDIDDWIIQGVQKELYPCKPDIFAATYEPVQDYNRTIMLNLRKICVFDFETDSPDPHTCQPVELAAIMIDPRKLKIIEKSDFSSMMRPADIDDETYYE